MLSKEQQQIIENSLWVVNTALQKQNIEDKDIKQDALLYMCKCIERFDPSKGIKWETFAYKNVYLYIKRHNAREKLNQNLYVSEQDIPQSKQPRIYCNEVYTKKQKLKRIYDECNELEKRVIVLRIKGYTLKEICDITGYGYKRIAMSVKHIKDRAGSIEYERE